MATFSERNGYVTGYDVVQIDSANLRLRTGIWNVITNMLDDDGLFGEKCNEVVRVMWSKFFHNPVDNLSEIGTARRRLRKEIMDSDWHLMYSALEDFVQRLTEKFDFEKQDIDAGFNGILEEHRSGYRLIGGMISPISDPVEVSEVSNAVGNEVAADGARYHLANAIKFLSDHDAPDYPNAIKEGISAVEAAAIDAAPGSHTTLGSALNELKKSMAVHPALVEGWKKLYGHTSDSPGVRHGSPGAPVGDQDLARYYVVTCSAMVNMLTLMKLSGPSALEEAT